MNGLFSQAAEAWWSWMAPMSVQAGLVVAVVWMLDRLLRRWAWRQMLAAGWWAAILKLAVPPSLTAPWSFTRLVGETAAAPGPKAAGLATGSADALATTLAEDLHAALLLVWLAGVVILAALAARRHFCARRRLLAGAEAPPPWLLDLANEAARKLGMTRLPPIRIVRCARGPAAFGVLRPWVLVPPDLIACGPSARIEHVLLHELSHVRRRDGLRSCVVLCLQIAYWFHPLAWIARRRLETLAEVACDESAARALGGAAEYRRTLLELARPWLVDLSPAPAGQGFLRGASQLLSRLEWLERPLPHRLRAGWGAVLSWVLVLALLGPLGRPARSEARLATAPEAIETWPAAGAVAPLAGCLQLRFAVLNQLARQQRSAAATTTLQPPNL